MWHTKRRTRKPCAHHGLKPQHTGPRCCAFSAHPTCSAPWPPGTGCSGQCCRQGCLQIRGVSTSPPRSEKGHGQGLVAEGRALLMSSTPSSRTVWLLPMAPGWFSGLVSVQMQVLEADLPSAHMPRQCPREVVPCCCLPAGAHSPPATGSRQVPPPPHRLCHAGQDPAG